MRVVAVILIGLLLGLPAGSSLHAQAPAGAPAGGAAPPPRLWAADLEKLVGPIALYPDDLIAIVLPAATTPMEVVKAQRFLEKLKKDPKLQPDKSMPAPVRNLLNYPEIIGMMSQDLDWTEKLGQAVVSQQKDVMAAVQTFRRKAQAAGNLPSNDKQTVVVEKEVIQIVPADPQVIYVPQYQPTVVVVQQPAPVVAYYPTPYPVYYYPYPPGAAFATGFFFGAATASVMHWGSASITYNVNYNEIQQNRANYASQAQAQRQEGATQRQT
jgi:hypothetical protein